MKYKKLTVGSWDQLAQLQRPGWLYRGQQRACWMLKSSLERYLGRHAVAERERRQVELDLIREFRRAYYQYASRVPTHRSVIEWLSVMQHHGAPTRLLDFSYSVYVACYFAVETAERGEAAAIWAIDGEWATRESKERLYASGKLDATLLDERLTEDNEIRLNDVFFSGEPVACACPVNPFYLNQRLRIQRGVFLLPGRIDRSFVSNLEQFDDSQQHVEKIDLAPSFFDEAIVQLFQMTVTRASLFPGLDGYSQALGVFHPALRKDGIPWYPAT